MLIFDIIHNRFKMLMISILLYSLLIISLFINSSSVNLLDFDTYQWDNSNLHSCKQSNHKEHNNIPTREQSLYVTLLDSLSISFSSFDRFLVISSTTCLM